MKVAFVASHSQSALLLSYYKRIATLLEKRGFDLFCGTLFDTKHDLSESQDTRKNWYTEAIKHIKAADIVVVELSYPSSANVGHEMTYALESGKPVVCLYKEDRDPFFIMGLEDDKLTVVPYNDNDLEKVLDSALDYAVEMQDTRFNFFISPKISSYLDWVSKEMRVPRAVYLRRLIEEDMKKNKGEV